MGVLAAAVGAQFLHPAVGPLGRGRERDHPAAAQPGPPPPRPLSGFDPVIQTQNRTRASSRWRQFAAPPEGFQAADSRAPATCGRDVAARQRPQKEPLVVDRQGRVQLARRPVPVGAVRALQRQRSCADEYR
jgi:hypothetical protein